MIKIFFILGNDRSDNSSRSRNKGGKRLINDKNIFQEELQKMGRAFQQMPRPQNMFANAAKSPSYSSNSSGTGRDSIISRGSRSSKSSGRNSKSSGRSSRENESKTTPKTSKKGLKRSVRKGSSNISRVKSGTQKKKLERSINAKINPNKIAKKNKPTNKKEKNSKGNKHEKITKVFEQKVKKWALSNNLYKKF